jgi:hypothetical protein
MTSVDALMMLIPCAVWGVVGYRIGLRHRKRSKAGFKLELRGSNLLVDKNRGSGTQLHIPDYGGELTRLRDDARAFRDLTQVMEKATQEPHVAMYVGDYDCFPIYVFSNQMVQHKKHGGWQPRPPTPFVTKQRPVNDKKP